MSDVGVGEKELEFVCAFPLSKYEWVPRKEPSSPSPLQKHTTTNTKPVSENYEPTRSQAHPCLRNTCARLGDYSANYELIPDFVCYPTESLPPRNHPVKAPGPLHFFSH